MNKSDKIYVAGHRGLVGSAIVRLLENKDFQNIIYNTHHDLDLTDQAGVNLFFKEVILCHERIYESMLQKISLLKKMNVKKG